MAAGGIYDHLVGGFCRYSTDPRWLVPHFEKMLTDQALLARAYLHAWQETGTDDYLGVVTETLDFVLRDLSTPEGALYSSFDADAGGVEGAHATFTLDELRQLLPGRPRRAGGRVVRHHRGGQLGGPLHPGPPGRRPPRAPARIEEARALLAAARAERVQPARDEKVLTEWNAMAVATLAEVAAATGIDALRPPGRGDRRVPAGESMYADGRLMRSWQGGRARHLAVAADHAWLAEACVRLSELTGQGALARAGAARVARRAARPFWDDDGGRLLHHRHDAEALVVRPKEFLDGAVPSTNSIAVAALLRVDALGRRPRRATRPSIAPSRWPRRCSTSTRARSPTWWRPCPC